tara:strand:+ start:202 stop:402 length:201 start_codon:yes stop_codon:yes gene_type:complete
LFLHNNGSYDFSDEEKVKKLLNLIWQPIKLILVLLFVFMPFMFLALWITLADVMTGNNNNSYCGDL